MPRLTVQDLFNTLHEAEEDLRAAAGSDGQLSRQDFNRILEDKQGNERALLEALYRFLREEDRNNMRITRAVLERGLKFIQEKIIGQYEIAPGGLSFEESNAIKALGEDTLPLGFQLKRAAQGAEYLTPMEIFEQLKTLTPALFFDYLGSEGSEALEAVHIPASIADLTPETFAKALKLNPENPAEVVERFVPADEFFISFVSQHAPFELDEKALEIVTLMRENLRQPSIFVIGEDNDPEVGAAHPAYVVGVADDGSLVGFKSQVIWT